MSDKVILVFSGKRKSGKDYVTGLLQERLGKANCDLLRLSGPLKKQFAKDHQLDYDKLLDASEYKEKYRAAMIKWGEDMRLANPAYFCNLAIADASTSASVWVITDARRKTDMDYFNKHFNKVLSVRVVCDDTIRIQRGWVFTANVDDAESECNLDDYAHNIIIRNDGNQHELEMQFQSLMERIREM
ncbi:Phosphomevalonate kinase [Trichoplax sp. H2]|uniref:Phosphomevalonate kinase n=1 Tax=Trichoplax adhaerens TaxID=10228 RepID=B3RSA8_TRIAD|nr:hypothetical protein TRIADDRAFT_22239 [Trichoplax adhaerens]EDV27022.1 hypothetical protein TRIADDRAFT_22239 [Trichoplax adhaerens]RDD46312.1 Phosphomevalonate kinase [Trichoplax sp. H2]|eukprot:XP_002111018.1 hypothetical protein TRIADDRAFT_22239 [Trichoplax adhaerens]